MRWDEAASLQRLPEWIFIHGLRREPMDARIRRSMHRYHRVPLTAREMRWENIPEPYWHRFRTRREGPAVKLYRLREGARLALREVAHRAEPGAGFLVERRRGRREVAVRGDELLDQRLEPLAVPMFGCGAIAGWRAAGIESSRPRRQRPKPRSRIEVRHHTAQVHQVARVVEIVDDHCQPRLVLGEDRSARDVARWLADRVRERSPSKSGGQGAARQPHQRRGDVQQAHGLGHDPGRQSGCANQQRNPDLVQTDRVTVGEEVAVLPECLAVVRRHDHGWSGLAGCQARQESSHVGVDVADLVVVAPSVGDGGAQTGKLLVGRNPAPAGVLLEDPEASASGGVADLRGAGRLVGPVWILVVDPNEPGTTGARQPVERGIGGVGRHPLRVVGPAAFPARHLVVVHVEASFYFPCALQQRVGDERSRAVATGGEHLGQRLQLLSQGFSRPLGESVLRRIRRGEDRRDRGHRERSGCEGPGEPRPGLPDAAQRPPEVAPPSVAAESIGAERVDGDQDEVGPIVHRTAAGGEEEDGARQQPDEEVAPPRRDAATSARILAQPLSRISRRRRLAAVA